MARPKKSDTETRRHRLYIRVTDHDKKTIEARAATTGLTVSEYLRRMALNGQIELHESKADFALVRALDRIGVNLNQITKKLNTTGQLQSHSHAATLTRINVLLDELQNL